MDKKLTKEDIINVAKSCTDSDCKSCPLEDDEKCATNFLNCIIEYMKNEPAPAATGTSSEVVSKDTGSILHLDDSTKEQICQAYDTAYKACTDILLIYDEMSKCERRAFDIGEVYGKICSTRNKLENMRGEVEMTAIEKNDKRGEI